MYLAAMVASGIDYVELGFRFKGKQGFRGPFAFTTDSFLRELPIPPSLKVAIMINAADVLGGGNQNLEGLFAPANQSPVAMVRIACHYPEFAAALPVAAWLKQKGYRVGMNLMQVVERSNDEIVQVASACPPECVDVLYFADSTGGMSPRDVSRVVRSLRSAWAGEIGIHTHDNMGRALANSVQAVTDGATWVDGTVTGMGRGAGNAKTEYLLMELDGFRAAPPSMGPLLSLVAKHFRSLQAQYGWGTNPYYYLAGRYNIHPTFIQEMLANARFSDADILAVIDHLRATGGAKYSLQALERGLNFYQGDPAGRWDPAEVMSGKLVLILGSGPGVARHKVALERFIREMAPVVIALNTQRVITEELINFRAASHPVRLLEDAALYREFIQPLIVPASMLAPTVCEALVGASVRDFGLAVKERTFVFGHRSCVAPSAQVIAYSLGIAGSGRAAKVLLAGFDGFSADDPRTAEMNALFTEYAAAGGPPLLAITPSRYMLEAASVYSPSLP